MADEAGDPAVVAGSMSTMIEEQTVHAIVLTGGRSSRMGGRHKPGIVVDGSSVIDRTLSALWSAAPEAQVIIAGSDAGLSQHLQHKTTVVREHPPFSGPVAGVAAALETIPASASVVLLLGGDTPFLSDSTIGRLLSSTTAGAAVTSCLDSTGHLQYLCSAWQYEVFRAQVERIGEPAGVPLRALFEGLSPECIACDPDELRDIDTPEDLARAVTTSDGRPVPEALLAAVEYFDLNPQQTTEVLEFARKVKYASSAANPAVAAFVAGQVAGSDPAVSVTSALRLVLDFISTESAHELSDDPAGTANIGSLSGRHKSTGQIHGHGSG